MNDLEIYKKAALVLGTGENIALVTVISTTGSTPGKVGYKMLVWEISCHKLKTRLSASTSTALRMMKKEYAEVQ
jgi:hypothetical protein